MKRNKNYIHLLELDEETTNQDVISTTDLIGTSTPSRSIDVNWDRYYPAESHPPLQDLEEPFTEEEIREAVVLLGADKAPDPSDFNMRFYQHFWSMLRQDFLDIF